jgi:hypothetical protein
MVQDLQDLLTVNGFRTTEEKETGYYGEKHFRKGSALGDPNFNSGVSKELKLRNDVSLFLQELGYGVYGTSGYTLTATKGSFPFAIKVVFDLTFEYLSVEVAKDAMAEGEDLNDYIATLGFRPTHTSPVTNTGRDYTLFQWTNRTPEQQIKDEAAYEADELDWEPE